MERWTPALLCDWGSVLTHTRPVQGGGVKMGSDRSDEQEPPMSTRSLGPSTLVLSASVARRYYIDGRSKIEIAQEFEVSRFKVARLLEAARESGLVRIEIGQAGLIDVDLSTRLQDRYRLR